MIDINTEAEKALTIGVHEGVLKGSGRMIVGSVSSEVYRRIEDYARKAAGAEASPKPGNTETAAAKARAGHGTCSVGRFGQHHLERGCQQGAPVALYHGKVCCFEMTADSIGVEQRAGMSLMRQCRPYFRELIRRLSQS